MTMDIVKAGAEEEEHVIKPQASAPAVNTSDWPLLLKNYERRTSPPAKATLGRGPLVSSRSCDNSGRKSKRLT